MANTVFRQKTINKINSPESLNDYVKVTNPSVWIILVGTLILIVGALVFCAFGKIDENIYTAVSSDDGIITVYVNETDIDLISKDMKVVIDENEYSILKISDKPVKSDTVDEYVLHKGSLEDSQWLFPVTLEGTLKDGAYSGSITVGQIALIKYIFN